MANPRQEVLIDYTNWRGERGRRRIQPLRIVFENNEWHPESQWLLEAVDVEKGQERSFALAQIHSWFSVTEIEVATALVKEKPSTSFLQRRMQIGYGRATCLMETLEAMGVVSERSADGTRKTVTQ